MFRELDAGKIVATIALLQQRIHERFPAANLAGIAGELLQTAHDHAARSRAIRRPDRGLRLLSIALLVACGAVLVLLFWTIGPRMEPRPSLAELVQTVGSACEALFFLGAGAVFVWTLEARARRQRCVAAVNEMRAMAHIVDLHQLTKDPDHLASPLPDTPSSPPRSLSPPQLARYLEYCSEMLALIGKVAALYVQGYPDNEARQAVDDVEDLTTSLSRKIWQKIMILEPLQRAAGPGSAGPPPPA